MNAQRIPGKVVVLDELPACDLCGTQARYDAPTRIGPWAYLCDSCFDRHGFGRLGVGAGQYLVTNTEVETGRELPSFVVEAVTA